jgi:hypothetical protein
MYFLYFDPAVGAMIVQAIVAAVAGVLLFSRNLLHKIKVFFGISKPLDEELFDDINLEDSEIEKNKSGDK